MPCPVFSNCPIGEARVTKAVAMPRIRFEPSLLCNTRKPALPKIEAIKLLVVVFPFVPVTMTQPYSNWVARCSMISG